MRGPSYTCSTATLCFFPFFLLELTSHRLQISLPYFSFSFFFFVSLFNIPLAAVCVFLSSITKTKNKFSASRFIELQRAASFFSVLVSLSLSFFFLLALLYSLFTKGNNVVYSSLSRAQTRVSVKSNKEKKTVTIHRSASLRFAFALFFFFPSHLPFCLLAHPLLCFFFFWLFFPL